MQTENPLNGSPPDFFQQHEEKGEQEEKVIYSFWELWEKKDEPTRFLIDDLIPASTVSLLIGEDGIGKSQFAQQLCLSISLRHESFLGMPLNCETFKTCFVATEDSKEKFTGAVKKQIAELAGDKFKANKKTPHVDFIQGSDCEDHKQLIDKLDAVCKIHKYDLVVIDTLLDAVSSLHDGDINSSKDTNQVLQAYQKLCNKHNVTLLVLHHVAKSKITEKHKRGELFLEKNDTLGSSRITGKVRTVLSLTHDKSSFTQEGDGYTNFLHVVKNNLMGNKYKVNALKLFFNAQNLIHEFDELKNIEELQEDPEARETMNDPPPETENYKPDDVEMMVHLFRVASIFGDKINIEAEEFRKKVCKVYNIPVRNYNRNPYNFEKFLKENGIIVKTSNKIIKGARFKDYEPEF